MADIQVKIRLISEGVEGPDPRWAGDLLAFQPLPGASWGAGEGHPRYGFIRVNGVDLQAARARCARRHTERDAEGNKLFHVRATHWINLANLPPHQQNRLNEGLPIVMDAAEFYSRCNDRVAALRAIYG